MLHSNEIVYWGSTTNNNNNINNNKPLFRFTTSPSTNNCTNINLSISNGKSLSSRSAPTLGKFKAKISIPHDIVNTTRNIINTDSFVNDGDAIITEINNMMSCFIDTVMPNSTNNSPAPASRITDSYTNDYDIIEADRIIRKWLIYHKNTELPKLKTKLEEEKRKEPLTLLRKKSQEEKIKELLYQIDELESNVKIEEYNSAVKPYLDLYRKLNPLNKVVIFGSDQTLESEEISAKKLDIINNFLEIASKYYNINVVHILTRSTLCPGCGLDLEESGEEEDGIQTCECGVEITRLVKNNYSNDSSRISTSGRSNYEDRGNFYKQILRFQGKQNVNIPDSLYKDIDKYLIENGLPHRESVINNPIDSKGIREGTARTTMIKALRETGNSSYYDDLNLICHNYWGWLLPDISNLEDMLMKDYDDFMLVYPEFKGDRKSSMNGPYVLCRLLLKNGFNCSSDDFKIVETEEIKEYHERTYSNCCQKLGWEYVPLF